VPSLDTRVKVPEAGTTLNHDPAPASVVASLANASVVEELALVLNVNVADCDR
jgi:hypothetical protein